MEEELRKIKNLVIDHRTLKHLARIMEKGFVERYERPISPGKEALVFKAISPEGVPVAVKVYRAETSKFSRRRQWLLSDERFKGVRNSDWALACAYAKKEFRNLSIAERIGTASPRPLFVSGPVVVMEFLGKDEPFPKLADLKKAGREDLLLVLRDVKKLWKGGLVHGDLSGFNILMGERPYLIDFSQGITRKHPQALALLKRDLKNVLKDFQKRGALEDR